MENLSGASALIGIMTSLLVAVLGRPKWTGAQRTLLTVGLVAVFHLAVLAMSGKMTLPFEIDGYATEVLTIVGGTMTVYQLVLKRWIGALERLDPIGALKDDKDLPDSTDDGGVG